MEGFLYGVFVFTVCMAIVFLLGAMLYYMLKEAHDECTREQNREDMARTIGKVLDNFEGRG